MTAVKWACGAMKKTSPWARGGLGYAVTHLLFASKLFVKEERLGPLVSVVLGLLLAVPILWRSPIRCAERAWS